MRYQIVQEKVICYSSPLGKKLFEIKYVEFEKPNYQLRKNYTYQLTCEVFEYEDEVIDTNVEYN